MKKVGIIGCGAIGSVIAEYLSENKIPQLKLVAVFDINEAKSNEIVHKYPFVQKWNSINELIANVDLVVECACVGIVRDCVELSISNKKDILVLSVGGLLNCEDLFVKAYNNKIRIMAPSGAISGIDAVKASSIGKIERILLTTFKPPKGLKGVEYIEKKGIDIENLKEDTEVFCGTVEEAVQFFPKNINVAAAVSLASGRVKNMRVRIVVCPSLTTNVHELRIEGKQGIVVTRTENVPSPKNPKTSFMAVLSALRKLSDYQRFGLLVGT